MNDKVLLKLSLITSIIGVVMLMLVLEFSETEQQLISEAKCMQEGDKIFIRGFVKEIRNSEDFTSFKISKEESLKVKVFDNLNLKDNDEVMILGDIIEYNNEKEVLVSKLTVIN